MTAFGSLHAGEMLVVRGIAYVKMQQVDTPLKRLNVVRLDNGQPCICHLSTWCIGRRAMLSASDENRNKGR